MTRVYENTHNGPIDLTSGQRETIAMFRGVNIVEVRNLGGEPTSWVTTWGWESQPWKRDGNDLDGFVCDGPSLDPDGLPIERITRKTASQLGLTREETDELNEGAAERWQTWTRVLRDSVPT